MDNPRWAKLPKTTREYLVAILCVDSGHRDRLQRLAVNAIMGYTNATQLGAECLMRDIVWAGRYFTEEQKAAIKLVWWDSYSLRGWAMMRGKDRPKKAGTHQR